MTKQIYLIRHGETEYNREGRVQGQGINSSINALGLMQAQAFFDTYQEIPFELVVTSNLLRTQQTVAQFKTKGIPFYATPDINEISWGRYEGMAYGSEVSEAYQQMIRAWDAENYDFAIEGGESANALAWRIQRFLDWLTVREERTILVCSHGRTMRCMLALIHQRPLKEMELYHHHNTGLYRFTWADGVYETLLENDVRHLEPIMES